jgi:hypothetical protein
MPRTAATRHSKTQDIPQSKVRSHTYAGVLKPYEPPLWQWLFPRQNDAYHITDDRGRTIVFLDFSALATGTPLTNFLGKAVTVQGSSTPHPRRGTMVVKAQNIFANGNPDTKRL